MRQYFVGIDVAKAHLDVHLQPGHKALRVANDSDGIESIRQELAGLDVARIVVEATGGYELSVVAELHAAGQPVVVVNPRQVRDFSRASGRLAKTDKIDAAILAHFAAVIRPQIRPIADDNLRRIKELVARRRQLVGMRQAELSHGEHARQEVICDSIGSILKAIDGQIQLIEKVIASLIKNSPIWTRRLEIITSVPGLAERTAAALLANLPELGQLNRRQAAALVGLAPINRDSGAFRENVSQEAAEHQFAKALYMPTLVAIRHNPAIRNFYEHLLANGKAKMTAVIACMRKLLLMVNALIRENRTWRPIHA